MAIVQASFYPVLAGLVAGYLALVEVVKKPGFDTPVPEVIATFPGDSTTPTCNTMTFKD